jgi:hypothetical protein
MSLLLWDALSARNARRETHNADVSRAARFTELNLRPKRRPCWRSYPPIGWCPQTITRILLIAPERLKDLLSCATS